MSILKKIASWFQPAYDKIDKFKFSDETLAVLDKLSQAIPKVISDAILAYIKEKYANSEEGARKSLRKLRDKLNDIV